jgi:hypothetical protein
MKISVAMVVHQPDTVQLQRTLQALDAALAMSEVSSCVMIADNTPPSGRLSVAQQQRLLALVPHATERQWQILQGNRGFGAGHNALLALTASDCHLVLNPDLELAVNALHEGLAYLQQHPQTVLVAPRVCDEQGNQQFLGKRYPSVWVLLLRAFAPAWLRNRNETLLAHYEARDLQTQPVPAALPIASGACMLCRTAALKAAGGFDERYFLYFEDFDLSMRLHAQGQLVFLPSLQAVHHGGYAARKGWRHIAWFAASAARFFNRFGWRWL